MTQIMVSRATSDRSLPPSMNVDVLETGHREFPKDEDKLASFLLECHGPGKYILLADPGRYRSVWRAWVVEGRRANHLAYFVIEKDQDLEASIDIEGVGGSGQVRRVGRYPSKVPSHIREDRGPAEGRDAPGSLFMLSPSEDPKMREFNPKLEELCD